MSKYFDGYAKFEYNEMSKDKLVIELKKKVEYIKTLHSSKDKEISQLKNKLALTEKALEISTFELDFYKNHSQTTNSETYERIINLRNEILKQALEMIKSE